MWIRVSEKHDYWPSPRRMITYTPGDRLVNKTVGEALIDAGVAVEINAPNKEQAKIAKETGQVPDAVVVKPAEGK